MNVWRVHTWGSLAGMGCLDGRLVFAASSCLPQHMSCPPAVHAQRQVVGLQSSTNKGNTYITSCHARRWGVFLTLYRKVDLNNL